MDPNTATREEFTNFLLNAPVPDNATDAWCREQVDLKDLLRKLAFDKAMEPNLQQTYMTPANSKNKIYFMWDFIGRTLGFLHNIPPDAPFSLSNEAWSDVFTRSMMAADLLLDTKPGMLDMVAESGGTVTDQPQVSDEIKAAARNLKSRAERLDH